MPATVRCGRSTETELNHEWFVVEQRGTEVAKKQLPNLYGVNVDFEHRPTANNTGAVNLEQVLRPTF